MAVVRLEAVIVLYVGAPRILHRCSDGWPLETHRQDEVRGAVLHCWQQIEQHKAKTELNEVSIEIVEEALFIDQVARCAWELVSYFFECELIELFS